MESPFDRASLDRVTVEWCALVEGWMDTKYGAREAIQMMQYERGDMMFMDPIALSSFVEEFWRVICEEGTGLSIQRFEHVFANNGIFLLVENHHTLLRDMYQYLWMHMGEKERKRLSEVSLIKEQVEQVVIDMYVSMVNHGLHGPWWSSALSRRVIFWGEGQREGDVELTKEFWWGVRYFQSLGLDSITKEEKEQIRAYMYALPTMAGECLGELWDMVVQGMVLHPIYQKREAQRELAKEQQWVQGAVNKVGH